MQTFMKKLGTGYSMYFNKRYQRTGVLFQGRYKSEHVDSDRYLKYLFSYIHLNPIKLIQADWKERGVHNIEQAQQYLASYQYSSLLDYQQSNREEKVIIDPLKFPQYFLDRHEVDLELLSWLDKK